MMLKHEPVLVTGGAGFIGGQTVLCLLDAGIEVVVLDDLSTGSFRSFHKNTEFYEGKIHDQALVKSILSKHGIRSVLHFAGSIKVDESIENPLKYYHNNTEGSRCLIETATEEGVENIVFSSTAAVYGNAEAGKPVDENLQVNPLNPYGWSKLFTERTLRDVYAAGGPKYAILRYFNVAGADPMQRHGQFTEKPSHLIGRALDAVLGRLEKLHVFGNDLPTHDGTGVRDYIHVKDLADAHLVALSYLQKGNNPVLTNLGYGRGYSVLEVIKAVENVVGKPVPYEFVAKREGEAPSVVASTQKLAKLLKWTPKHNALEKIIHDAYLWSKSL